MGVMLIDFSKAYDRVDRKILYDKLRKKGIRESTIGYIMAIHDNSKIVIGKTERYVDKGVP